MLYSLATNRVGLVITLVLLLPSATVQASSCDGCSQQLTLNAYIMKNHASTGLRIEADKYNFLVPYQAGKFNDLSIPFRVYSSDKYKLELQQYYYQCGNETNKPEWTPSQIKITFDKKPPIINGDFQPILPFQLGNNYSHTQTQDTNDSSIKQEYTPINNELWNQYYRQHAFTISHYPLQQTNTFQVCQGMIGILASHSL